MSVNVVINYNGQGQAAIAQYIEIFGIEKPAIITYGDLPQDPNFTISESEKNYIMSATINICGLNIMIQDLLKPMQTEYKSNITISIDAAEETTVTDWFHKMSEGGEITCPLQEMPWSKCYGAVKDRFGIPWQFQCLS